MVNNLKQVERQESKNHKTEIKAPDDRNYSDAQNPILDISPQINPRKDQYAYGSMIRSMNNQISNFQKKQRQKLQKLKSQK